MQKLTGTLGAKFDIQRLNRDIRRNLSKTAHQIDKPFLIIIEASNLHRVSVGFALELQNQSRLDLYQCVNQGLALAPLHCYLYPKSMLNAERK
jgi:hypothetical protein